VNSATSHPAPVARLVGVGLRYGKTAALDGITLDIPAACMVGLIGPDGVGKSSLLSLVAGSRAVQEGSVHTLGGDMASARHRERVCPHIAYMPQGLGKNLYPTLSAEENLQFFGRLFGHSAAERRRRIDDLTRSTGLSLFLSRPAGKLSGGMKQKLGLCCALIHDPDLLILDEPTTGVDPLARAQFWDLIQRIRADIPGIALRTTFIVGFPGETQAYFEDLLEFIREARFERLGVFAYSREEDTRAGKMGGQLSDKIKRKRRDLAMAAQHSVAVQVAGSFVGRTIRVLVEQAASPAELKRARVSSWEHGLIRGQDQHTDGLKGRFLVARGEADAPDIDGRVYVRGRLPLGEFAQVKIVGHTDYDLIAET